MKKIWRVKDYLLRSLGVLCILLLCACASIEPWVKPYERQNLADPIMALGGNPVASNYLNHVHQARESARGAESSAGGGCGCN